MAATKTRERKVSYRWVTTTSVLSSLTEKVGGDLVAVEPLMGPGVDPHTFELTPGDVRPSRTLI
ncbi:MAG: zinc ABC transporter substrate-binding protein [Thermomicrobiales bacterium]